MKCYSVCSGIFIGKFVNGLLNMVRFVRWLIRCWLLMNWKLLLDCCRSLLRSNCCMVIILVWFWFCVMNCWWCCWLVCCVW